MMGGQPAASPDPTWRWRCRALAQKGPYSPGTWGRLQVGNGAQGLLASRARTGATTALTWPTWGGRASRRSGPWWTGGGRGPRLGERASFATMPGAPGGESAKGRDDPRGAGLISGFAAEPLPDDEDHGIAPARPPPPPGKAPDAPRFGSNECALARAGADD